MSKYEEEDYYHGLLPREDTPSLLKTPGDFLLRTSQVKVTDPRVFIISLALQGDTRSTKEKAEAKEGKDPPSSVSASLAIRHYVLAQTKATPPKWTIDGSIECDLITELVEEYRTRKQPLNKDQPGTVLITPIKRPPWELTHDNIKLVDRLGKGAFGEVFSGKLKLHTGQEIDVAVKVSKADDMNKDKIKEVMKEARLMRNFDHPNVVKLYGVAVGREPVMIVMELVDGGGLATYLKKGPEVITTGLKLSFIMDAAWGIEYLHMKQIIHRDIALRNCLVSTTTKVPTVKISDFGLSREGYVYQVKTPRMLPTKWLAPESLAHLIYTQKSDVYSFGVLAWQIFTNGDDPYSDLKNGEARKKILVGSHLPFPADTPNELSSLITVECWDLIPDKRSCMTTLCKKLEVLSNRAPSGQQESLRRKARPAPLMDKFSMNYASLAATSLERDPGMSTKTVGRKLHSARRSILKKVRRGRLSDDGAGPLKKLGLSGRDINKSGRDVRDKSGRDVRDKSGREARDKSGREVKDKSGRDSRDKSGRSGRSRRK